MLRLNASFQKKVPAEVEFSSKSYMASVEVELPTGLSDPELREKIANTFRIVRESVERELGEQESHVVPGPHPRKKGQPDNTEGKASNKQIAYLLDLSKARNVPLMQLNADIQTRFGVISVYELSRRDCSRLIDEFQRAA